MPSNARQRHYQRAPPTHACKHKLGSASPQHTQHILAISRPKQHKDTSTRPTKSQKRVAIHTANTKQVRDAQHRADPEYIGDAPNPPATQARAVTPTGMCWSYAAGRCVNKAPSHWTRPREEPWRSFSAPRHRKWLPPAADATSKLLAPESSGRGTLQGFSCASALTPTTHKRYSISGLDHGRSTTPGAGMHTA